MTQKCLLGTTTIILCSGQISVLACDVYREVFICGSACLEPPLLYCALVRFRYSPVMCTVKCLFVGALIIAYKFEVISTMIPAFT